MPAPTRSAPSAGRPELLTDATSAVLIIKRYHLLRVHKSVAVAVYLKKPAMLRFEPMAVDKIKHTKPASQRTFLDELEPIPYEITEEELAAMDPRMKKILFGIEEEPAPDEGAGHQKVPEKKKTVKKKSKAKALPKQKKAPRPEKKPPPPKPAFDPASVADFEPVDRHTVTMIFASADGDEELEDIVSSIEDRRETVHKGRRWLAVRFDSDSAVQLQQLNEKLGKREDVHVLVDGRRVPFGRSLWLPLMYIFTAGRTEQETTDEG